MQSFILDILCPMASVDERDKWWRTMTDLRGWERFQEWRLCLPRLMINGEKNCYDWWTVAYTISDDQLEMLTRVVVRDIMQEGLVKTQSTALVPYNSSLGASSARGSGLSAAAPSTPHEILHPVHSRRYRLVLKCRECGREWVSEWAEGGDPYVEARDAGWAKSGGNWTKHYCGDCQAGWV